MQMIYTSEIRTGLLPETPGSEHGTPSRKHPEDCLKLLNLVQANTETGCVVNTHQNSVLATVSRTRREAERGAIRVPKQEFF